MDTPYEINRAVIQKGEVRMIVFYCFDQKCREISWDFAAKFRSMMYGITTGRTNDALVRLTTPILRVEDDAVAEKRLQDLLVELQKPLPRFIPEH